jgi:hypothetical protein
MKQKHYRLKFFFSFFLSFSSSSSPHLAVASESHHNAHNNKTDATIPECTPLSYGQRRRTQEQLSPICAVIRAAPNGWGGDEGWSYESLQKKKKEGNPNSTALSVSVKSPDLGIQEIITATVHKL